METLEIVIPVSTSKTPQKIPRSSLLQDILDIDVVNVKCVDGERFIHRGKVKVFWIIIEPNTNEWQNIKEWIKYYDVISNNNIVIVKTYLMAHLMQQEVIEDGAAGVAIVENWVQFLLDFLKAELREDKPKNLFFIH